MQNILLVIITHNNAFFFHFPEALVFFKYCRIDISVKRCFLDCSEQQPNQQTGDLPMTTTYESIDPSSTPEDTAYTRVQNDYESADVLRQ